MNAAFQVSKPTSPILKICNVNFYYYCYFLSNKTHEGNVPLQGEKNSQEEHGSQITGHNLQQ